MASGHTVKDAHAPRRPITRVDPPTTSPLAVAGIVSCVPTTRPARLIAMERDVCAETAFAANTMNRSPVPIRRMPRPSSLMDYA